MGVTGESVCPCCGIVGILYSNLSFFGVFFNDFQWAPLEIGLAESILRGGDVFQHA